ncbi:uncharacterized protein LOC113077468 [Carassius auratus]|uniref:Uncharacterized protein LOC113077468 n=1 Tax=Carassius auratus TaxID=7957 RepID=A0A6P6NBP8_CARAU|nr:uncharacterized protein LOC113077468 [Carassius auratus]
MMICPAHYNQYVDADPLCSHSGFKLTPQGIQSYSFSQNPSHLKKSSSLSTGNDKTVTISVMEGDSVALNTGVTELQTEHLILWTFRDQNSETRLAEIYKKIKSVYDIKENNERFRDRLQIDERTGSLTVTNINKLHSGLYKVQIINGDVKHKSFSVAVNGHLTAPVISDSPRNLSISERSLKQYCSVLCSVVNVSHVTLSWYKGNSLLSSISVSDLSISLSLPLEIECLDDSYRCAVSYSFTNQTKHLSSTDLCQTCSDGQAVSVKALIIAAVFLLLLLAVSVLAVKMFCRSGRYKEVAQETRTTMEEVDHANQTFTKNRAQDTGANGQKQTENSEVAFR